MHFSALLTIACVSLSLTACAINPAPQTLMPRLDPQPQWQAPLPHNGELTDLTRWWQNLGDPLLVDLLEAAQQASPSLASARSRVIQSRAALTQARAALGPTVDLSLIHISEPTRPY